MNHIPFAAFPRADRLAVADAVRRSGVAARQVCVSQLQLPEAGDGGRGSCVTMVTAPGWYGSYAGQAGWLLSLEHDLGQMRALR